MSRRAREAGGEHNPVSQYGFGNAPRRLQDIGVGAFADDPLRKGFDVARQIGIKPDRHVETMTKRVLGRLRLTGCCLWTGAGASKTSSVAHWRGSPEFCGRSSRRLAFGQTGREFLEFAACRNPAPNVARCRSISRRAKFRRASAPATMRSMRSNLRVERLGDHRVHRQAGGGESGFATTSGACLPQNCRAAGLTGAR